MKAANDNSPYRFYVYVWRRPDTGQVFYVGKGRGKRDVQPKDRHNKIVSGIVAKLKDRGLKPIVERLHENITEETAHHLEVSYIKLFGRRNNGTGILANMTDGGEGTSGWVPSNKTRRAISESNAGRSFSDDHKAKLSAAHIGKPRSPEAVKKSAAARVGRPLTPEHRAACAAALRLKGPKGASGLKGVSFNRATQKWMMTIRCGGASRSFYGFPTPEAAAIAYDQAAYTAWGSECYLNFGIPAANVNGQLSLFRDSA